MAREFVCAYGNCQETNVPIVMTMPGERARFCCMEHAATAAIRRARLQYPHGQERDKKLSAVETLMRDMVGDGR